MNAWYEKRIKAYSSSALSMKDDPDLIKYRPSLRFAEGVTSSMVSCFEFKRIAFYTIRDISMEENNILCESCKITMIYLSMA